MKERIVSLAIALFVPFTGLAAQVPRDASPAEYVRAVFDRESMDDGDRVFRRPCPSEDPWNAEAISLLFSDQAPAAMRGRLLATGVVLARKCGSVPEVIRFATDALRSPHTEGEISAAVWALEQALDGEELLDTIYSSVEPDGLDDRQVLHLINQMPTATDTALRTPKAYFRAVVALGMESPAFANWRAGLATGPHADAFAEEAIRWMDDTDDSAAREVIARSLAAHAAMAGTKAGQSRAMARTVLEYLETAEQPEVVRVHQEFAARIRSAIGGGGGGGG